MTWDGVKSNAPSIKMRVTESGNVGIGNSHPAAKLVVAGKTMFDGGGSGQDAGAVKTQTKLREQFKLKHNVPRACSAGVLNLSEGPGVTLGHRSP